MVWCLRENYFGWTIVSVRNHCIRTIQTRINQYDEIEISKTRTAIIHYTGGQFINRETDGFKRNTKCIGFVFTHCPLSISNSVSVLCIYHMPAAFLAIHIRTLDKMVGIICKMTSFPRHLEICFNSMWTNNRGSKLDIQCITTLLFAMSNMRYLW